MNYSEPAKSLGSRGGKMRARSLSPQEKKKIASLGAQARVESLQMAKRIVENFQYLEAISELSPPIKVKSVKNPRSKLPGFYV